jgi:hypothetical protein
LSILGGEVQSLDEARVTAERWHGFCCAASIVANPEGWFCQVEEDLDGGAVKFEEGAVIGNLAFEELRR